MKFFNQFRYKILMIFIISILLPSIFLSAAIAIFYTHSISTQRNMLVEQTLTALSGNLGTYLNDLDRLTQLPYTDSELLDAIQFKYNSSNLDKGSYDYYNADEIIDSSLRISLNNNRQDVKSALLVDLHNDAVFFDRYSEVDTKPDYNYLKQDWIQKIINANGKAVFINSHMEDYISPYTSRNNNTSVFSVARLIKDPFTLKKLAVLVANADNAVLKSILSNINFGSSSIFMVYDTSGNFVYSAENVSSNIKKQILNGSTEIKSDKDSYLLIRKKVSLADWNLVVLLSNSDFKRKTNLINLTAVLFILIEIIIAIILFLFLGHSFTGRFLEIRNVMARAKKGDFNARYTLGGKDELAVLGHDLNDMIAKAYDSMQKEQEAIISMKTAEYYALQSQISPHFLYNTLNGFLGLNCLGETQKLENAILSLTGLLRYTLEHQKWTRLEEEFSFLEKYCSLQRMRFSDRLSFTIESEDSVRKILIPKLLIQPLVENAIIHGIEPLSRNGMVSVKAAIVKTDLSDILKITVEDNGVGFNQDKVSSEKQVGLKNVQERLNQAFPKAIFSIKSHVNSGTQVIISIPIMEEENE